MDGRFLDAGATGKTASVAWKSSRSRHHAKVGLVHAATSALALQDDFFERSSGGGSGEIKLMNLLWRKARNMHLSERKRRALVLDERQDRSHGDTERGGKISHHGRS